MCVTLRPTYFSSTFAWRVLEFKRLQFHGYHAGMHGNGKRFGIVTFAGFFSASPPPLLKEDTRDQHLALELLVLRHSKTENVLQGIAFFLRSTLCLNVYYNLHCIPNIIVCPRHLSCRETACMHEQ